MKRTTIAFALVLTAAAGSASAQGLGDQYYMGVGRWKCSELVDAMRNGPDIRLGQAAGWVLGFWSATTIYEASDFVDKVEKAGGKNIVNLTIKVCEQNPDAMVGTISKRLLVNTRSGS